MLEAFPKDCTVGCKRNSKGHTQRWTGYKLHVDTADGDVPISYLVLSASLHDSQAAIPLARLMEQRVDNCYELMDSAYSAKKIVALRRASGRVPIIDPKPRKKKAADRREQKAQCNAGLIPAERVRYREYSTVERAGGRLEDEFGGRNIPVRGHEKVLCNLMFSVVKLTVNQMLRMVL